MSNTNEPDDEFEVIPADDDDLALPEESFDQVDPYRNRRSPEFRALQDKIFAHLTSDNYRPVKPKVMLKQLVLSVGEQRALRRAIKFMTKEGRATFGTNHLVYPPDRKPPTTEAEVTKKVRAAQQLEKPEKFAHRADVIVGLFRQTSRGTGYVRPTGTPRSFGRDRDVFIPANKKLDAASGDKVAIRLAKRPGPDGKLSGEVVEVLERETHRFVGVYDERGGTGIVLVDGKVFADPIVVGDAGAKNVQVGDKVVIDMVRFPAHNHPGEGVVTEVLGAKGEPGVDTLSIIREFDLPGEFSETVLNDARAQAAKFTAEVADRLDLTGETIITIDPVDARDFDDAISLRREVNGHWRLGVHIADVSHFVPLKSALDTEARDRATSIYLPDRVIPMLPEIISNHLASLQPNQVRYTQSCFIEFDADGLPLHAEVHRAAIQSKRRFTYEEVDEYLRDREAWREKLSPDVWELLGRMHTLAMRLRSRRLERGAIELTLPEVKIDIDKEGRVSGAHLVQHTESHQIIEEFMLAANEAVARLLSAAGTHFLRRIHEQPDLKKLKTLTGFVRDLGLDCESLESRFEIKRVIAAVAGTPQEHAVNYAVLRSMQKAVYSPIEEGHYALHSDNYCHFTSPIRRYPDLTIHRMLNAIAEGQRPRDDFAQQTLLGEHCSEREQRAEDAERELTKVKLLEFLSHRIGTKLEAVITGVEEFGLFAQGTQLPAEGLIPIQSLGNDFYHFDRATHSLVGHRHGNDFRLGDRVLVEIAFVNVDRRELDLRIVKRLHSSKIELPGESRSKQRPFAEPPGAPRNRARRGTGRPERGESAARPARGGSSSNRATNKGREMGEDRTARKKKQRLGKRERQAKKKKGD